jgi:hypothetical protein
VTPVLGGRVRAVENEMITWRVKTMSSGVIAATAMSIMVKVNEKEKEKEF